MKEIESSGLICLRNEWGIDFSVCKIDYFLREDGHFKYIFTPYYEVIDLLEPSLFQGIPGLDLDLRKKEYVREDIVPTFISERVPSPSREDYEDFLTSVGLEFMDPIRFLILSCWVYSGDSFFLREFNDKEEVVVEDFSATGNSYQILKMVLDHMARGDVVRMRNGETIRGKATFDFLLFLYAKNRQTFLARQAEGILNSKALGRYKGRRAIAVDELAFREQLEKVRKKEITPKEAAKNLGISIDKYYRLKNKFHK